jgi:DNA-binding PadR family transcriptional regulator
MRHALLGLLAEGPRHGYELKGELEGELVPLTPVNFGQVYSTLDRLQRDGLVTHEAVAQGERPDKKVYSLTEAGRGELYSWMASPSAPSLDLRNETFLKLALSRRFPPVEGGFTAFDVVAVERRAAFEQMHQVARARFQAEEDVLPETGLLLALAAFRLEAFVKWLDECERVLETLSDHGTADAGQRSPPTDGGTAEGGRRSDVEATGGGGTLKRRSDGSGRGGRSE